MTFRMMKGPKEKPQDASHEVLVPFSSSFSVASGYRHANCYTLRPPGAVCFLLPETRQKPLVQQMT